jgi:hypothetical protein
MPYIALMHDDKTECSYSGYARQEWKAGEIEFPPCEGGFQPISSFGISDTTDGPIAKVLPFIAPARHEPRWGTKMWFRAEIELK